MANAYIGIDPGSSSGAIVVIDEHKHLVYSVAMPAEPSDIVRQLRYIKQQGATVYAALERVRAFAMPGRRMGATSAFGFGANFGALQAGLHAAEIPFDLVEPATWPKVLNCTLPKGPNATKARKEALVTRAAQLFPHLTLAKRCADALLLAEYMRRQALGAAR